MLRSTVVPTLMVLCLTGCATVIGPVPQTPDEYLDLAKGRSSNFAWTVEEFDVKKSVDSVEKSLKDYARACIDGIEVVSTIMHSSGNVSKSRVLYTSKVQKTPAGRMTFTVQESVGGKTDRMPPDGYFSVVIDIKADANINTRLKSHVNIGRGSLVESAKSWANGQPGACPKMSL